jgi:hypothetical protein
MAQNSLQDLPKTIAQDVEGFVPAPVRKFFGAASDTADKVTAGKKDLSWHDKAVDDANESFRKSAEKKVAALNPKLGQKKKAASKPKGKGKASQKRSY